MGGQPDDPAPSPPFRPPPSRSGPTAPDSQNGNPPGPSPSASGPSSPLTPSSGRRWILIALSATLALAIVGAGIAFLVRPSNEPELPGHIAEYATFISSGSDQARVAGVCALVRRIESQLLDDSGAVVRVRSDWNDRRVFGHAYWVELLLDRLGPNPRTSADPLLSSGSDAASVGDLESQWSDVGLDLEVARWRVDDASSDRILELSERTLATLATAPFAADCPDESGEPGGGNGASAAARPTVDQSTSTRWTLEGQSIADPAPARAELWLGPPTRVDPDLDVACALDPARDAVVPARVTLTNLSSSAAADLGFGLQRRDGGPLVVASATYLASGPVCRTADSAFDLLVSFDFREPVAPGDDATGTFLIVVRGYFSSSADAGDASGLAAVELKPVLVVNDVAVDPEDADLRGPSGPLPPPLAIVSSLT